MQSIEQLELTTERLILKVIGPEFAPQALDYFLRNRAFLTEWNPAVSEDFYTLPYHQERLRSELELMIEGRSLRFWLFKKEDLTFERTIGNLAFNNIIRGAFQSCHLGYQLDERETNRGLITEALRCAIDFVFDELKLHRIEANVMPRNNASKRVLEKCGFAKVGFSPKMIQINGIWEDHEMYARLEEG